MIPLWTKSKCKTKKKQKVFLYTRGILFIIIKYSSYCTTWWQHAKQSHYYSWSAIVHVASCIITMLQFYIHGYSNQTRYFNLLIASHSLALQCMRLLMKTDKLHPKHNSWSCRRQGGNSWKYKCTAYFSWTSWMDQQRGEKCVWLHCVASQGVLRYICSAGVKMRTVPSIDTVRKAQRKILSNTCATNFQSWTTWETRRDGGRKTSLERKKKKPLTETMWLFANRTHADEKYPTIITSLMKCSFLMCLLM